MNLLTPISVETKKGHCLYLIKKLANWVENLVTSWAIIRVSVNGLNYYEIHVKILFFRIILRCTL